MWSPGRSPRLSHSSWALIADDEVLLYVHRNRRFIRDGSPGRPPRLSHGSWALTLRVTWVYILCKVTQKRFCGGGVCLVILGHGFFSSSPESCSDDYTLGLKCYRDILSFIIYYLPVTFLPLVPLTATCKNKNWTGINLYVCICFSADLWPEVSQPKGTDQRQAGFWSGCGHRCFWRCKGQCRWLIGDKTVELAFS